MVLKLGVGWVDEGGTGSVPGAERVDWGYAMTVPTQGHLKLVIRYADGRTVRGVTDNFWPGRDTFHVQDVGRPGGSEPVEIHVSELKAVYVVKDFAGSTSTGVGGYGGDDEEPAGQRQAVARAV